ncbi:prepilin-type N-terminal cleavage/methylation domain-containing protein [Kovacikia minuta CCNUW1]|uniref:prepilin-type N-terminal cleavage/methylation domain-containing protein n=1 Tax=Kovacikia minuta TaxID=2931930 RepID=UPI001CCD3855|nr:prepilin-type N-terminal cleavage/methylation domain-containing protein [Kovacikia minuta]UBF24496.1 prepilin-type N-terminal cleavage/methylation domain-containing protein [Kovacikia minuta CCNUW1]
MNKRIRSKRSTAGFTLLEVLVVIIVIGILFAIAAPGWESFLSRQRVNSAREQVLQTIRQAQSQARSTRTARVVYFDPNNGAPRVASAPFQRGGSLLAAPTSLSGWKTLGGDSLPQNALRMATFTGKPPVANANNQLVFDGNGAVAQPPNIAANQTLPFYVTVSRGGTTAPGTNRCVRVDTLLGATRLEEGAYNAATDKGCP